MSYLNLPTVAEVNAVRRACPKGDQPSRLQVKAKADKNDARQLAAFRKAVWTRDDGKCRLCGCRCKRTLALEPKAGHVHHVRGRNVAPADRYNPKAALLLCGACHAKAHAHTVKVPKP